MYVLHLVVEYVIWSLEHSFSQFIQIMNMYYQPKHDINHYHTIPIFNYHKGDSFQKHNGTRCVCETRMPPQLPHVFVFFL